jgi:glycosyltransferase involved in cell wall biosynthesis
VRVTLVTNLPSAYRTPLYSCLHELLVTRGGEFAVVYGAHTDRRVQWSAPQVDVGTAPSRFLRRGQLNVRGRTTYINPTVVAHLRETQPDVAILGGYAPWIYAAAAWCRLARVPYLVWSGETAQSARLHGTRARWRLPLLRRAAGFLAYGPAAAAYFRLLGLPEDSITVVGNGIDYAAYAARVEAGRPERDAFRASLGVRGPAVLSVGGKGLGILLEALPLLDPNLELIVAGTAVQDLERGRIIEVGRLSAAEMPMLYAAADCLAHFPLVDFWPHAINEALAAGLPVVATGETGVPDELLSGPGCRIVTREPEAIAAAIAFAVQAGAASSSELREAIRAPTANWHVGRMAQRIAEAAARATTG